MHTRPPMRITAEKWRALPEYSHSLPTGTTPGKLWKAHRQWRIWERRLSVGAGIDAITNPYVARWDGEWVLAQYYTLTGAEAEKYPGQIGINWYRPVIVCRSGEGLRHGQSLS